MCKFHNGLIGIYKKHDSAIQVWNYGFLCELDIFHMHWFFFIIYNIIDFFNFHDSQIRIFCCELNYTSSLISDHTKYNITCDFVIFIVTRFVIYQKKNNQCNRMTTKTWIYSFTSRLLHSIVYKLAVQLLNITKTKKTKRMCGIYPCNILH